MHACNPDSSKRLKLTLSYLRQATNGRTTAEIQKYTGSMAPATDVSELRHAGHDISCDFERVQNGRKVFRYRYFGRYLNG